MPIRRWDKSRPPSGPYTLNRDAPQARGLVAWWPMGGRSTRALLVDDAGNFSLSGTTTRLDLGPAGAPTCVFNGTSDVVNSSAAPVSAMPLTLAAWATAGSSSLVGSILSVDAGLAAFGSANFYRLVVVGSVSPKQVRANQGFSGSEAQATYGAGWVAGQEFHTAGVFTSTTSRAVYYNGALGASDTTSLSAPTVSQATLGRHSVTGSEQYWSGTLGEACVWGIAVPAHIIARLHDPSTRFELWYPLRSRKWMWMPLGSGGQTVAITQVSETDTAQALTAVAGARTVAIGQVSSTETAQALTVAATRVVALGQVASTETAQSLTATTTVTTAITAAQETDTAQSITSAAGTTTAISQVASTETAQAVTATNASTVAITQVQSTDTAQALTAAATKTQAITQAASTETAQAFTAVQPGVFTAVNESDTAQALSVVSPRTVAIGQVAAVETAQALTPVLTTTTGITLALEIDAAQALASIADQSVAVTQAQETDTARALTVFFEGGALDTVALYSIVTQLVSLSSKQARTRSGDSYIAPIVSRDSHIGD